jgi:DNA-binding beta-propeller fold protein YncE
MQNYGIQRLIIDSLSCWYWWVITFYVRTLQCRITSKNSALFVRASRQNADIPVGRGPYGIGVNEVTNRIYIANNNDDTVSVMGR